MREPQHDPTKVTFAIRPSMVQSGRAFLVVPVDRSLLISIGLVVIYWGQFELIFDEHLDMLIYDNVPKSEKLRTQWKARKNQMVQLTKQTFGDGSPIANYFEKLVAEADEVRWKRDAVAHGTWASNHPPVASPLTFSTVGKRHGKTMELTIDLDTLDQMWHDLAHLAGSLQGSSNPAEPNHALSSHDRSLLRSFVLKSRPNLPLRRRFPDPPTTSHR